MFYWVAVRIEECEEPLVALLRESKRDHRGECNDSCLALAGGQCDCGADEYNARVDKLLEGDK